MHPGGVLGKKNSRGLWALGVAGELATSLGALAAAVVPKANVVNDWVSQFKAGVRLGISYDPPRGQGGFVVAATVFAPPLLQLADEITFYFLTNAPIVERADYQSWRDGRGPGYIDGTADEPPADALHIVLRVPVAAISDATMQQALQHGWVRASVGSDAVLVLELVGPADAEIATSPAAAVAHALAKLRAMQELAILRRCDITLGIWWAPQSGCNGYTLPAESFAELLACAGEVDFYLASYEADE